MLRDALGYQTSVVGRAWTGKQDGELISASVANRVAGAGGSPASAPYHAEQVPTGVLPTAVVVDLEAVEIEEQDCWMRSGIAWRRAATQPMGEAWRDRRA